MVARIRSGKSLRGAINYNEHKVMEGKAVLLLAEGYPRKKEDLRLTDKVIRLQKLAELNPRVITHCLHISLNFDVSEKLDDEKLQQVAEAYMKGIGFGSQPYLVYRHDDAAHQHLHIVSTNIQKDGKRISLHNLGKVQSEAARKAIEIRFGLVKAGEKVRKAGAKITPAATKTVYGKSETKRAITNVVTAVIRDYKFASLPELNAVLMQFNVFADRGAESTRMYEKKGLQYCLLDEQKNKVGVPVKASSIYGKPVLSELESRYQDNRKKKQVFKKELRQRLDEVPVRDGNLTAWKKELGPRGIAAVFRENEQGFLYGITYVDHNTHSVFNGSELGKQYSAAAMRKSSGENSVELPGNTGRKAAIKIDKPTEAGTDPYVQKGKTWESLPSSFKDYGGVPWQLRKKRKKKKRRG